MNITREIGEYSEKIAKRYWMRIAKRFAGFQNLDFSPNEEQADIWTNLIYYAFADDRCKYDLKKSIGLIGRTGSGKSVTINTLNDFVIFDEIKYIKNNKRVPLSFTMYNAKAIVTDIGTNGIDAMAKYCTFANICIDDLGAEINKVNIYGTVVYPIEEIIEIRYEKNLMTHFTSNLNEDLIMEKYGDRVYSRIVGETNIIEMKKTDYRIKNRSNGVQQTNS